MKNWLFPLISVIIICCIAIQADAHTIHVPGDQPTIQAGLDAASAGDTVLLACGNYSESELNLKSGVALLGDTSGAGCVVLKDLSKVRGQSLAPGTILHGLHFRELGSPSGMDLFEIDDSDLMLRGCRFSEFEIMVYYGILCRNSRLDFRDCTVHVPGGIVGSFLRIEGGSLAISDSEFRDSDPVQQLISLEGCDVDISASEFYNIECGYTAITVSESDLTLTDCVMTGSSGIAAYDGSSLDLSHCEFLDMQDQVLYSAGLLRMESCTIARSRGAIKASGDAELISCSILLSDGTGDAIRFTGEGRLAMEACLVAYNINGASLQVDAATELAIHCCNFIGNAGGDWVGPLVDLLGVNGNMRQLPKFCDVSYSHDYRLQADSPCAPENNSCAMLIGAWPVGCDAVSLEDRSLSSIKAFY